MSRLACLQTKNTGKLVLVFLTRQPEPSNDRLLVGGQRVIPIHGIVSKLPGESAVEEGLLQLRQRGELALVDRFQPPCLRGQGVELGDDGLLGGK